MRPSRKALLQGVAFILFPHVLGAASPPPLEQIQKSLGIPTFIAEVCQTNLREANDRPDVILVQDVHRHEEVQGHIAAMLLYGAHQWDLDKIYVEGVMQGEPWRPTARKITGAEIALALEPTLPVRFFGLEDPALYRAHVAAYRNVNDLRKSALREMKTARVLGTGFDLAPGAHDEESESLIRKLLALRLKPSDYASYLTRKRSPPSSAALAEGIRQAEHFYALADERSRLFGRLLAQNEHGQTALAVVGGFHTALIAQELEARGVTYVVLQPRVTQSGYDANYEEGLQQTVSALELTQP